MSYQYNDKFVKMDQIGAHGRFFHEKLSSHKYSRMMKIHQIKDESIQREKLRQQKPPIIDIEGPRGTSRQIYYKQLISKPSYLHT